MSVTKTYDVKAGREERSGPVSDWFGARTVERNFPRTQNMRVL